MSIKKWEKSRGGLIAATGGQWGRVPFALLPGRKRMLKQSQDFTLSVLSDVIRKTLNALCLCVHASKVRLCAVQNARRCPVSRLFRLAATLTLPDYLRFAFVNLDSKIAHV